MTSIGFIGLGIMGAPMAANLAAAGHDVRGYSRTAATRERARSLGVEPADSVRSAVDGRDVVITMLPDTPDVEAVLLGDDGVLAHAHPGSLVIDMSTIDAGATRQLHARAAERGLSFLDAPVSGGQAGAEAGELAIMIGGEHEAVLRAQPLFEAMGSTIVHVGDAGAGQTVKAANQIVVAGNIQILSEALWLLDRQGVDLSKALDVLGGGLAGSAVIDRKRAAFLTESFAPGFRLSLHHKDLGIAMRAAREVDASLPVAALVSQFVQAAVAQGKGDLDHSALYAVVAENNGGKE